MELYDHIKTSTLYAITSEVTELNKGKQKDVVYFQPGDNYESRIAKTKTVLKKTGSNAISKLLFFQFSTLDRGG